MSLSPVSFSRFRRGVRHFFVTLVTLCNACNALAARRTLITPVAPRLSSPWRRGIIAVAPRVCRFGSGGLSQRLRAFVASPLLSHANPLLFLTQISQISRNGKSLRPCLSTSSPTRNERRLRRRKL